MKGNLLNGKGEDRKLGADATQNDLSMKSETIRTLLASVPVSEIKQYFT